MDRRTILGLMSAFPLSGTAFLGLSEGKTAPSDLENRTNDTKSIPKEDPDPELDHWTNIFYHAYIGCVVAERIRKQNSILSLKTADATNINVSEDFIKWQSEYRFELPEDVLEAIKKEDAPNGRVKFLKQMMEKFPNELSQSLFTILIDSLVLDLDEELDDETCNNLHSFIFDHHATNPDEMVPMVKKSISDYLSTKRSLLGNKF